MKYLKPMNEHKNLNKSYVRDYIVIDIQAGVPEDIKKLIMNKGRGQNSYYKYYPGDGNFTLVSNHKDPSKALRYDDEDHNYGYEPGTNRLTDWLLSEGFDFYDEILFLIWW